MVCNKDGQKAVFFSVAQSHFYFVLLFCWHGGNIIPIHFFHGVKFEEHNFVIPKFG